MRNLKEPLCLIPIDVLAIALQDIQRVQKIPNIKINIDTWVYNDDNNQCSVCLAGAIMLLRDSNEDFIDYVKSGLSVNLDKDYDYNTQRIFYSINGFRLGKISETLRSYNLTSEEKINEFENKYGPTIEKVNFDESDPLKFYIYIDSIIKNLQSVGL